MILLDTHVLVWLWTGDYHLGKSARRMMDVALRDQELAVSAMTFWEVAMLRNKGRLDFTEDVGLWRRELLGQGLAEIPVDGEIGIRANALPDFHADPADRIIVSTALAGHRLLTADAGILRWSGDLNRLDARE